MLKKISIFKKSSKKDGHAPKNTLGKTTGGFTLIEMIVAVFILTIAVGAPLYSAAVALKISREAQNRIVAEYLAQEALEFIRNRRDENILNGESDPYQNILSPTTCGGGQCFVDVYAKTIQEANSCGDCTLVSYKDDADGIRHYGHNYTSTTFTNPTPFHRSVLWTDLPGVAAKRMLVEVTWPSVGGGTNIVSEMVYFFPYK